MHCENRETLRHEESQRFNLESIAGTTRVTGEPVSMQATMQPLRVFAVFVTKLARQDEAQEHLVFICCPNAHKQI
jgi:hypothetical protein